MQLHPMLRALRSDDTPQRQAQDRLIRATARWREGPVGGVLEAELACFAQGGLFDDFPLLSGLFTARDDTASLLVSDLVQMLAGDLAAAELGHVPMRHFTDGVVSTLLVGRSGGVTLTLVAIDGAGLSRRPAPVSASFAECEAWEHVLAGSGKAERITATPIGPQQVQLEREAIMLAPGTVMKRRSGREALQVSGIAACLVSLRLQRRASQAALTREYRLADGILLHQAAGSPRDSRLELTAALLGRMGRSDAAPYLAAMAREQGSAALRWHALRECLGLDTALGFETLSAVAAIADDPLAAAAGALRAQLIEAHPQLAEIAPCLS